jgi:hypothetical protein
MLDLEASKSVSSLPNMVAVSKGWYIPDFSTSMAVATALSTTTVVCRTWYAPHNRTQLMRTALQVKNGKKVIEESC